MDESLEDAALTMKLKYYDYLDNSGSSNADEFWRDFERARDHYKELKAKEE